MSSLLPDSFRDHDAPPRALVEALRDEPFEPGRIERAYARFLRQSAAAPTRWRGPRVVRVAALALAMGVGTVYAATLIRPLTQKLQASEASAPAEAPTSPPRTVSRPRAAVVLGE
ncbi:MAG TPA: hypothetical protein VHP33_12405, partial [Polyangiaceae bacterium]|nr:hypothetical protein [Polyangiaceae bacterium]